MNGKLKYFPYFVNELLFIKKINRNYVITYVDLLKVQKYHFPILSNTLIINSNVDEQ